MNGRRIMVMLVALGIAAPLSAQAPGLRGGGPAAGGPLQNAAEFLLSHTGVLGLANEQVVRLAELARQTDARREELRASLEAARPAAPPEPGATPELRARMQEAREQMRTEAERDRAAAIAVLTAEQQAQAWELIAAQARRAAGATAARPGAPRAQPDRGPRRALPRPGQSPRRSPPAQR